MRDVSHKTLIAIVLDHVNAWRKANCWSRETVVQEIVKAHIHIGGAEATGIRFEPQTADTFERWKVNADRVFRWLDDSSKDTNLLPANFLLSVLAAMPLDVRQHCLDDVLRGVGVAVRPLVGVAQGMDTIETLRGLISENSDAQRAVAALLNGATHDELLSAQRELAESVATTQAALASVEAAIVDAA
jgi:hypothetical protein